MTRMYLSPAATTLVKILLAFVECLVGLYNFITYPIRKVTFKAYFCISLIACALYAAMYHSELTEHLIVLGSVLGIFAASILATRLVYTVLKKKVSKKVAYLFNSPLCIPLNRFYKIGCNA